MKEYDQFSVEQLCDDPYFKDWVLGRLDADDKFWRRWQAGSAARQMLAGQARLLVMALHEDEATVFDADEIEGGKKKIIDDIDYRSGKGSRISFVWLRIAASLLIISGLGWWLVTNRFNVQTVQRAFTAADTAHQTIHHNQDSQPENITLPDGSSVKLAIGSELVYNHDFGDSIREVYLRGEAFFDVVKDAHHPFLVRTEKLTTKVLGTSFNITARDQDPDIQVSVRTGKVTVFKQREIRSKGNPLSAEIVLVPNQMAVFNKEQQILIKTLVANPLPVIKSLKEEAFVFEQAPVRQVYDALEKYYGVDITFDQELMSQCSVTADLRGEPLYKQLDLICEVLEAQYKTIDGQIVISAAGCKK